MNFGSFLQSVPGSTLQVRKISGVNIQNIYEHFPYVCMYNMMCRMFDNEYIIDLEVSLLTSSLTLSTGDIGCSSPDNHTSIQTLCHISKFQNFFHLQKQWYTPLHSFLVPLPPNLHLSHTHQLSHLHHH